MWRFLPGSPAVETPLAGGDAAARTSRRIVAVRGAAVAVVPAPLDPLLAAGAELADPACPKGPGGGVAFLGSSATFPAAEIYYWLYVTG